jgi:hypothetical protein
MFDIPVTSKVVSALQAYSYGNVRNFSGLLNVGQAFYGVAMAMYAGVGG